MASFIPENFRIDSAESVVSLFNQLIERPINSVTELENWLKDASELESHISEDMAWRYIRMTCDTKNKDHESKYLQFVQEIQPQLAPLEDQLNRKIADCSFTQELENESNPQSTAHQIYFRGVRKAIEIFREENIEIQSELSTLAQEYSSVQGSMSIEWNGEEITLQKASNFLLEPDRDLREKAWRKIQERRAVDTEKLEDIFDQMVAKRHQMALNAGIENYRDYMFAALGRYDYTAQDCKDFHKAIEEYVVPLTQKVTQKRKDQMKLEVLKPWDTSVDPLNRPALKPFSNGSDLLEKGIKNLDQLDPFFSQCLTTMKEKGLLDLDSRVGKAPGGYNYPLAETNMPFIFMNATGNLRDVETLVHEAGHAIHSFLMAPLPLNAFKNTPSEVAELASMSMELLSMEGWQHYFDSTEDLQRAKMEQIEGVINTLPWIATVDAFQHWIYENPNHTRAERMNSWNQIQERFGTGLVDYTELEFAKNNSWHRQLHIFEVPFYYIEYGIAQLGAIGIWKNYVEKSREEALQGYTNFMKLGYTQSIPEIYLAAGVRFDFSPQYVSSLMNFVESQWN